MNVYPEFVRALGCMPNLETVQILSIPFDSRKYLERTGSKRSSDAFRSVRTLVMPHEILFFIHGFSNLKRLLLTGQGTVNLQEITPYLKSRPNIEELSCNFLNWNPTPGQITGQNILLTKIRSCANPFAQTSLELCRRFASFPCDFLFSCAAFRFTLDLIFMHF